MVTTPDRFLLAGAGAALIAAALGIWLLVAPAPGTPPETDAVAFAHDAPSALSSAAPSPGAGGTLVIDVEGGVVHPGIARLPAGARVADAIVAAGGYGPEADLLEAAKLNLAAPLTDGQQVFVPLRGGGPGVATSGPQAGGGGAGGLVNLNTATPEELDTLPGIGPVTVQKIVAARQERPFATLEELTERKVLTSSQVDKIRDLVTLG
jgi:competence protein ComEA